jgi:hypothetical protein
LNFEAPATCKFAGASVRRWNSSYLNIAELDTYLDS